jgi:hypothetical protein
VTRYRLQLTLLSPVHVGTGEELTPTDYVVHRVGEGEEASHVLYALDMPRLLGDLADADRASFDEAVSAADPAAVRRWLHEHADVRTCTRWWADVNPALYALYEQGLQSARHELAVHPLTRTGLSAGPYIPGSSIKGAVRTAVLQHLVDQREGWAQELARRFPARSRRHAQRDAVNAEAAILGHAHEGGRRGSEIRADPFRAVRITDAPLEPAMTSVEPVDLCSLKGGKGQGRGTTGINLFYEMTYSALDGEVVHARGTLTLDGRLAVTDARRARRWSFPRCVSRGLSAEEIVEACRRFYAPRLEDEAVRVSQSVPDAAPAYHRLREMADGLGPNEALVRLGRFSHLECVTLAPPLRSAAGGNSRALAPGGFPMGWAALRLDPLDAAASR